MPNENCLEGIKCPQCGQEDWFLIEARCIVEVEDDGADLASPKYGNGYEWEDDSSCRCPECDRHGPLKDFRIDRRLPPDPDGVNALRAGWAGAAIACFRDTTGTDPEDAVCDLVADLMHWCDRNGHYFPHELERAQDQYEAETTDEPPTP